MVERSPLECCDDYVSLFVLGELGGQLQRILVQHLLRGKHVIYEKEQFAAVLQLANLLARLAAVNRQSCYDFHALIDFSGCWGLGAVRVFFHQPGYVGENC